MEHSHEPAYSAEQGFAKFISNIDQSIELLTKFQEKYPGSEELLEKIRGFRNATVQNEVAIFDGEFSSGEEYDKVPPQIKFYRGVLQSGQAMLNDAGWQGSPISEKLCENLKADFQAMLQAVQEEDPTFIRQEEVKENKEEEEKFTLVYVSLFCVSGELKDWEKILHNIDKQVISRPILTSEDEMKTLLRSKENLQKQGYAVLKLLEKNVIRQQSADRASQNEFGHELVSIKDSRIDAEVIEYFVHENHQYVLEHGLLVSK